MPTVKGRCARCGEPTDLPKRVCWLCKAEIEIAAERGEL